MIKDFKFFKKEQKILMMDSYINLRDIHNRQKVQFINWSQYPSTIDAGDYQVFEGNILEFSDHIKHQRFLSDNPMREITPTIYEIGMWRSGYFTRTYTFSNGSRMDKFISRGWKLKIHYNI